jgi:hypothetical protein
VGSAKLGDGTNYAVARVHIFPRPTADKVHEFPTFPNLASSTKVTWVLLADIGLPVVVESVDGTAKNRRRSGMLVALGGTRTWQLQKIEPEAGTVFAEHARKASMSACDSESDSDVDPDEMYGLRPVERSDTEETDSDSDY